MRTPAGRVQEAPTLTARTQMSDLTAILRSEPRMAPRVAFFLSMALLARLRARRAIARGDYSTWLRDESSRRESGKGTFGSRGALGAGWQRSRGAALARRQDSHIEKHHDATGL